MKTNLLAAVLALGFFGAGIFAFFFSAQFFDLLGNYYGTFNNHFVKDAGIAFTSSGLLLMASLLIEKWRLPFVFGGALFVVLHGIFHLQMLIMGMVTNPLDLVIEILVIIMPSVLTGVLVYLRIKEDSETRAKI